jgi:hypothetical protein
MGVACFILVERDHQLIDMVRLWKPPLRCRKPQRTRSNLMGISNAGLQGGIYSRFYREA